MKNTLSHKGYIGSVNYSAEDKCLYGKIEFINDLIMYDGDSVASIQAAFVDAVDSYIAFCAEQGKEPNQPFKGSFNVRIGETMHRQAAMEARKLGLNLNEFVKEAVRAKLAQGTLTSA